MYMGVEAAKLAIQPTCGHLNTNTFCNFNSGINLSKIKVGSSLKYISECYIYIYLVSSNPNLT